MRHIFAASFAALTAISSSVGWTGAAHAQVPSAGLPPYEVLTIVRSLDFEPLESPLRRGPTYRLRALDPYGEEVRLIVDARRGRLISVTPTDEPMTDYVRVPGPRFVPAPPYGFPGPRILSVPEHYEEYRGPRVIYGARESRPSDVPSRPAVRPPASRPSAAPAAPKRPNVASRKEPAPETPETSEAIPAPSSQFDFKAPPVQPLDDQPLPKVDAPPVQGLN